MKGQVFTVAKLHYVNGVVYEVARLGTTDMQTLADLSAQTTKSGKVKHPMVRVRTLARLAEGVGLINIVDKKTITITPLGMKYSDARAGDKWSISNDQQQVLGKYIISDYYRTETIYSITSLFELIKKGYTGEDLSHQFSKEIGKDNAWKSEVTFHGFTKFCSSYISELGLLDIDEKDIKIEEISREQRYQNDLNIVTPIRVRSGKIPRPKPKIFAGSEKYTANPRRARNALEEADFKCELNPDHATFINKRSSKQYMEAHHLIPMSKQVLLEYDIDVPENILCLCPTCHRKMHLAQDDDKQEIISKAFEQRRSILPNRGISIDIEALLVMYSIE